LVTKKMKKVNNYFRNRENLLFLAILFVFVVFCSYIVLNIKHGISPDENYHINISKAYSTTLLIPDNTEETFVYSDITRISYLSFWINARFVNLNFTSLDDISVMRFVNLFYSLLTITFTFLTAKRVINKRYYNLLPPFLLANTLMFAFLSASVNYDNLVNLFSIITIYFLVKYIKEDNSKDLLLMYVALCFGILSKFTILPLAFIVFLISSYFVVKRGNIVGFLRESMKKYKYSLLLLAFALLLCLNLYGINLIKYHSLNVFCDDILTVDQCMQNGIYSRSKTLPLANIESFSDFIEVLKLRMTPFEYLSRWTLSMVQKIFGVLGHKSILMPKYFANIYLLIFGVNTFFVVRKWKKESLVESSLIIIFLFYTLVLMVVQNYKTYLNRNIFDLALQGRYLFPVLPIFYIIISRYLSDIKSKWLRILIVVSLVVLFIAGCIPFFVYFLPDSWIITS
jgi:hypothetical protein